MNWRFSLFLVLLFGLLAAFSLASWDEFLCKQPLVVDLLSHKNKDGAIGCFEFWFNRYQTLIGSLVAIGAAGLAWRATSKTIALGREQIAINYLERIEERILALQDLANKSQVVRDDIARQNMEHIEVRALLSELRSAKFAVDGTPLLSGAEMRQRILLMTTTGSSAHFEYRIDDFRQSSQKVQIPIAIVHTLQETLDTIYQYRRHVNEFKSHIQTSIIRNNLEIDMPVIIGDILDSKSMEIIEPSVESFSLLDAEIEKQLKLAQAMRRKILDLADSYV